MATARRCKPEACGMWLCGGENAHCTSKGSTHENGKYMRRGRGGCARGHEERPKPVELPHLTSAAPPRCPTWTAPAVFAATPPHSIDPHRRRGTQPHRDQHLRWLQWHRQGTCTITSRATLKQQRGTLQLGHTATPHSCPNTQLPPGHAAATTHSCHQAMQLPQHTAASRPCSCHT